MRKLLDRISTGWMLISLWIMLLLPLATGLGLILKSVPILRVNGLFSLLTTSVWSPMKGEFGFLPFLVSSLLVTLLAILMSAPVCLLSAIHLTQYAPKWVLRMMHPVIDILAGIPSVVYGVWGILVIVPFVENRLAPVLGYPSGGFSIMAGGLVLAVMCVPYILNLLIEVFRGIPVELKEVSLSLGATYWETIKYVVLRQGFSGILSAYSLGLSKALGETIAVLMVVGNVVQIPENLFQPGYPLPALLANNYGEMMSIRLYDSALMFAALILFFIVLVFNGLARWSIQKTEIK